ncbi:hypothetical protein [Streptomyces sp. NPDC058595]|uniref:hypothetical protein n=1 Tax=Streptomyces sp. NPDC058595 TaxID=3346550 RepID=UPI003652D565
MPNRSNGDGADDAAAWHRLAEVTDRRRALWLQSGDATRWSPCGIAWDAIAVTPLALGLGTLAAMGLSPAAGYPVLADRVRDVLYILVPPGTAAIAASGHGSLRALSSGDQLLLPTTEHGTAAAHWISRPRPEKDPLLLLSAERLITCLSAQVAP